MLKRLLPTALPQSQPESDLLFLACQNHLTPEQQDRLRQMIVSATNFNWSRFVEIAIYHRVYPLVSWNLQTYAKDLVPRQAMTHLQTASRRNLFASFHMGQELREVAAELKAHGIEALTIRGPVLAQLLYEKTWLRDSKDIDILVHQRDFQRAEEICLQRGYIRSHPIEDNAYNQKLYNQPKQIEIELHWGVDSPFVPVAVSEEYYWERSVEMNFESEMIQTFRSDDLLMMLCFHGAKHRWHRLKWLSDISEFVRRYPDFDWQAALEQAQHLRIERIVLMNMALAHHLFQTPLPPVITARLERDRIVVRLSFYIQHWMFNQVEARAAEQLRGIAFFLLIREHPRDRLPTIWHALRYPKSPLVRSLLPWSGG